MTNWFKFWDQKCWLPNNSYFAIWNVQTLHWVQEYVINGEKKDFDLPEVLKNTLNQLAMVLFRKVHATLWRPVKHYSKSTELKHVSVVVTMVIKSQDVKHWGFHGNNACNNIEMEF